MDKPCYLLLGASRASAGTENEIRKKLKDSSIAAKTEGMKEVLVAMLNGEKMDALLMPIIQDVLPTKDKALKKLLLYFFEAVDKKELDGSLKREFILVWYVLLRVCAAPCLLAAGLGLAWRLAAWLGSCRRGTVTRWTDDVRVFVRARVCVPGLHAWPPV